MLGINEGQRFVRTGDQRHVWVVDAILRDAEERRHMVVLVSEDDSSSREIPLTELADRTLYQPLPPSKES